MQSASAGGPQRCAQRTPQCDAHSATRVPVMSGAHCDGHRAAPQHCAARRPQTADRTAPRCAAQLSPSRARTAAHSGRSIGRMGSLRDEPAAARDDERTAAFQPRKRLLFALMQRRRRDTATMTTSTRRNRAHLTQCIILATQLCSLRVLARNVSKRNLVALKTMRCVVGVDTTGRKQTRWSKVGRGGMRPRSRSCRRR